jgi:hypothetical protein
MALDRDILLLVFGQAWWRANLLGHALAGDGRVRDVGGRERRPDGRGAAAGGHHCRDLGRRKPPGFAEFSTCFSGRPPLNLSQPPRSSAAFPSMKTALLIVMLAAP